MGRKLGSCSPSGEGELGPHLSQCCLGRDLSPCQVASSSIQPSGHNRHGPKIGGGSTPFLARGARSPSNRMSFGMRPTFLSSGSLIHPPIWPQQIWAKNWGLCPLLGEGVGPHLTQCAHGRGYTCMPSFILIHPTVWPQYTNVTDRTGQTDRQTGQQSDSI